MAQFAPRVALHSVRWQDNGVPSTLSPRTTSLRRSRPAPRPTYEPITLGDAVEEWFLDLRAANRSPQTLKTYRYALQAFETFLVMGERSMVVGELTSDDLRAFGTYCLETRSEGTALTRWGALSAFLNWCERPDQRYVSPNPMIGWARPKINEGVIADNNMDDLKALLASCDQTFKGRRDYAIMRLLLNGLRRGEIASLTVESVDLRELIVYVHGKGNKDRRVNISPKDAKAIRAYLKLRIAHHSANLPYLFLGKRGHLEGNGIEHMLRNRSEALGIKRANAHTWRHTWAGEWMKRGGSELGLQMQGGWANGRMIARYTAHNKAANSIAEAQRLNIGGNL